MDTSDLNKKVELLESALKQAQRQAKLGEDALVKLQQAKRDLSLYQLIFYQTSEGIMVTDPDIKLIDVNDAFTDITGYKRKEAIGKNPSFLHSGKQDEQFYQRFWETLNKTGYWEGEIWDRRKSGDVYPAWLSISAIKNDQNEIESYVAIFTDITARKFKEEELELYAYHDPLTGLPNRRTCLEQLANQIKTAERSSSGICVMFMDLDYFKKVNDELGHRAGDLLLIEVGRRLKNVVRDQDLVSRLGGDEFVVILNDTSEDECCKRVSTKILDLINEPFDIDGHECKVGISIGISHFPKNAKTAEALLACADKALYESKSSGRNKITFSKAQV